MEDIVITCNSCNAIRSIAHVEDSTLSDADVAEKAGHCPGCKLAGSTKVTIDREQKLNEINISFYTIKELNS